MNLYVLQSGKNGYYCLFDGNTRIFTGSEQGAYDWKHKIEDAKQQADNRRHMNELRKDMMVILVNSGHTQEEAIAFLKERMPFLFKKQKYENNQT